MPKLRYGLKFDSDLPELNVEIYCYRTERTVEQGGLGAAGHFRNIVELIWGKHNKKRYCRIRSKDGEVNPWWERMNEGVHRVEKLSDGTTRRQRYIGFSGCAASAKTDYTALYAIVNWMIAPIDTLVLVTSTDMKAARRRIWGRIVAYYDAMPEHVRPGSIIPSQYQIVATNDKGKKLSDESSISLVPGEKKHEREALDKIIGAHNKRVFFLSDELPELSEALLETAYSNLSANPFFQMFGLGNFKSRYDSFGQFIQPKAGWDSITVEDDEWETERGICIRFDGLKSPNVLAGEDIWPIYSNKNLADHREDLGENTAGFWRMVRSFETPLGMDDAIYTEADFTAGKAYDKAIWLNKPVRVSFMDPSFTQGGDRCPQFFGSYGTTKDGIKTISFDSYKLLREDVRKKEPRDYQIARQFRDNCIAEGVSAKHSGLDATGAGMVLWSIISEEWSPDVLKVDFSGAPSEMAVLLNSTKTAKQAYDRKVSELWYIGKEFMKYGQLRGIPSEMAREMKARKYVTKKSADGLKISVETKGDMKERLLFSPDLADAGLGLVHLCRQRLGAVPGTEDRGRAGSRNQFNNIVKQANNLYEHLYSEPMEIAE